MHLRKLKLVILSCITLVVSSSVLHAQENTSNKLSIGFESDIMPFINKGYHASFWLGMKGVTARFVHAKSQFPSAFVPDGFKDMTSVFYEVEINYFFGSRRNQYRGLWYALGAGYTKQSIVSKSTQLKGEIDLFDIHTGIGYALPVYKRFYINPWIGPDYHVNAPDEVAIGDEIWNPAKVNFVGGAKIGYSF